MTSALLREGEASSDKSQNVCSFKCAVLIVLPLIAQAFQTDRKVNEPTCISQSEPKGTLAPVRFGSVALWGWNLSGHYSRDWSEYVNVIRVISGPFAREFR